MRTIKFRAWENDYKIMYTANQCSSDFITFEGQAIDVDFFSSGVSCLNYTLMQFIGLHDVNGREIYEGDIVRVDDGRYSGFVKFNEDDLSYVIENNDGGFGFVNGQIFDERPEYRTYEVLGNIYENPKLLRGDSD